MVRCEPREALSHMYFQPCRSPHIGIADAAPSGTGAGVPVPVTTAD